MDTSKTLRLVFSFIVFVSLASTREGEVQPLHEATPCLVSTPIRFPLIGPSPGIKEANMRGSSVDIMERLRPPEQMVDSYPLGENLAVVGMYLFNNFAAEDGIFIVGGVKNTGASTQDDVVVQFFLGDPDNQGAQIGDDVIIPSIPPGSTVYDSVSWGGFTGSSRLYCLVDACDSVDEENEADNIDSLAVGMVDEVPWVWQAINGFCNYASLGMMYNFYGADHDVYEAVELACCPYSMVSVDDWLLLYGGWRVCQTTSDYEFAGLIRNLSVNIEKEASWSSYLAQMRAKIDAGIPFMTSVDPYYLPQPDYDIARIYGLHSGHAVVITGYTDEAVIYNDPGVGLDIGEEPGMPHPERRGKNVLIPLVSFRHAVEHTWGASYILISYAPTGPMPDETMMLQAALEKSILRLAGDESAFDPVWGQLAAVFGAPSFANLKEDMNLETFQTLFNAAMTSAGGDLVDALNYLAMDFDIWGCLICYHGSAAFYQGLGYLEAAALSDLSAQLSSAAEEIGVTWLDMLDAIYLAGGNASVAEPYLSQIHSDLDEVISLEDSILINLTSLYGHMTSVDEGGIAAGKVPEIDLACYPNPFNQRTLIDYQVPQSGFVQVAVFNLLGQEVGVLVNGHHTAGRHLITWDGRDERGREVASGLYFCQIRVGTMHRTIKMALLR